jgi:hypothetical protein
MPETLTTADAHCRLVLTAATDGANGLHLHGYIVNTGEAVLYLCDNFYQVPRPYPSTGEPVFDILPDLVHVQVDAIGVHLDKAIMDLSFHKGIQGLDIPFLTRLPPGQAHAYTFRLELPLVPYRVRGLPPGQAAAVPLPLRFSLGYFVGSPEVEEHITEAATTQGPALRIALFLNNQQQIITVGPFQQLVPVANAVGNASPQTVSAAAWTPWGP